MAFKLTKAQVETHADISQRLEDTAAAINTLLDGLREAIEAARAEIEEAIALHNGVIAEAVEFAEGVASEAEEAYDEKPEKWQEGERGQMAQRFVEAWQGFDFGELDIDSLGVPSPDDIADADEDSSFSELPADTEEC